MRSKTRICLPSSKRRTREALGKRKGGGKRRDDDLVIFQHGKRDQSAIGAKILLLHNYVVYVYSMDIYIFMCIAAIK